LEKQANFAKQCFFESIQSLLKGCLLGYSTTSEKTSFDATPRDFSSWNLEEENHNRVVDVGVGTLYRTDAVITSVVVLNAAAAHSLTGDAVAVAERLPEGLSDPNFGCSWRQGQ
jgi:hypothetical protein